VYQIATVDSHNIPHVRSLVHRAILFPENSPSLPILLTTTDVRTPKVTQILSNPTLEVAWWLEGTKEQYRFSGHASIIPSPSNPLHNINPFPKGSALAKLSEVGEDQGKEDRKYDWEKKRREMFDSMSVHMRASWVRPVPGSTMAAYEDAKAWPSTVEKLGEAETEQKKHQQQALDNFALVLIEPIEVDWVELGVVPNQRTKFTRKVAEGNGDEWEEMILVP